MQIVNSYISRKQNYARNKLIKSYECNDFYLCPILEYNATGWINIIYDIDIVPIKCSKGPKHLEVK